MTRVLATAVVFQGEVYRAGDVPPDAVAARIRNPACWKTVEQSEPATGDEHPAAGEAPEPQAPADPPTKVGSQTHDEFVAGHQPAGTMLDDAPPWIELYGPGSPASTTQVNHEAPQVQYGPPQTDTVVAPPAPVASEDELEGSVETPAGVGPVTPEEPLVDDVELVDESDSAEEPLDPAAPEEPAQDLPAAPPRAGAGSGLNAWRQFAASRHVDVESDAGRDEIIAACVRAGVIS